MAPTILDLEPSAEPVTLLVRSISSLLLGRSTDASQVPPLASVFALLIHQNLDLTTRSKTSLIIRSPYPEQPPPGPLLQPLTSSLNKRQNYILAIPTTYATLNTSPAPGAVVGITLGAIGGFVIVLFLFLTAFRFYSGRVVTEEIITTTQAHKRRSRSRSRSMSEAPRRQSRRETVVVEERVTREVERSRSRPPAEVVEVIEEHDDIVEVIEEHSPERRPTRKENRRSGFRTVDPAEIGGGGAPLRKVSRR